MEIMRGHGLFGDVERLEAGGSHGEHVVDVLHFAFDQEIRIVEYGGAFAIENVGHDHGIRDAGFIFDAEEEKSFCGAWTLAADDASGGADGPAVVNGV